MENSINSVFQAINNNSNNNNNPKNNIINTTTKQNAYPNQSLYNKQNNNIPIPNEVNNNSNNAITLSDALNRNIPFPPQLLFNNPHPIPFNYFLQPQQLNNLFYQNPPIYQQPQVNIIVNQPLSQPIDINNYKAINKKLCDLDTLVDVAIKEYNNTRTKQKRLFDVCSTCNQHKSINEFTLKRTGQHTRTCKACSERKRNYYKRNLKKRKIE